MHSLLSVVRVGLMVATGVAAMIPGAVPAAAAFPEKPVTIVVGFGAGGGVDAISRAASKALSDALGQPIVIQNRPGAGGALAVTGLKSAPADGYTLVATTSTTLTFDTHAKPMGFTFEDFEPVAAFGIFPEALVALPSRGWKSFKDVVAEARTKGSLNFASTTSIDRVVLAAIAKQEKITLNAVPTKGGSEAVAQVLGGHVDFAYSSGTYYSQAKAGKLMILASLGDKRFEEFPEAPTLRDLGYAMSSVNMIAFLVPKATPADVKARLVEAFKAASVSPDLTGLLKKRNMGSVVLVGNDAATALAEQSKSFAATLKNSK